MMLDKRSSIKVNKLVVYADGKIVYDEEYHDGVNIIRGKNSSGKSTIINFLYFILGGDLRRWTPQSESCDVVTAEIVLSGVTFTLKREVDSTRRTHGMYIYYGTMEKAITSAVEGWEFYSFARTEKKLSFSQVLFNALGLPEVKSDLDSAITMHQILRVIFVDQLDIPDTLIRYEKFDSRLTCSTIGDIMYGIYDDALYEEQKQLVLLDKELSYISSQVESLAKALLSVTGENITKINQLYEDEVEQLKKVDVAINDLKQEQRFKYLNNASKDLESYQKQLIDAKKAFNNTYSTINDLKLEIEDSNLFIIALDKQREALNYSISTRKALGELTLTNCPSCLSKLVEVEEGSCILCKEPNPVDSDKSQAFRMLQEIELQIKESRFLQDKRIDKLHALNNELPLLKKKVNDLQKKINTESNEADTTFLNELEKLYTQKGKIESDLNHLLKHKKSYDTFIELNNRKTSITLALQNLKDSISYRKSIKDQRAKKVKYAVQRYTLEILKQDQWQSEFQTAKYVEVDFDKNSFSLDGRSSFSASSLVYLKNAIRFGIFFASLELDFMRYPRFILCDNIEDKGMEESRSKLFQRTVVNIAQRFKAESYQIIYSTSMIEPALNNEIYCVGEEYGEENKSLKIQS